MPTTNATVFANIISRLGTLYSTHKRLPNPYDVELNNAQFLVKGWGLALSPAGSNTKRFVCSTKSYTVGYQLKFCRVMDALAQDATKRMQADLDLIGDFEAAISDAHVNNMEAGGGALVTLQSYDGIGTVIPAEGNSAYRVLVCNIDVEIFKA